MYGALEVEKYAIKHESKGLGNSMKYIERPPKGAEVMRKKKIIEHGVLKRYDTEYKMGFLSPRTHNIPTDKKHHAGRPYAKVPFGEW
jgi:hypothetical protein